jgi:hypothetical protein
MTLQPLPSEFPYKIVAWEGDTYKWNEHNTMFVVILRPSVRLRYNQVSHAEGSTGAPKHPPPHTHWKKVARGAEQSSLSFA